MQKSAQGSGADNGTCLIQEEGSITYFGEEQNLTQWVTCASSLAQTCSVGYVNRFLMIIFIR